MPFYNYNEAKGVVLDLNISSLDIYKLRRKEDPRLPSSPERYFKNKGWIDTCDFFSKDKIDTYITYAEAKEAVNKLVISSKKEYQTRYKEDPKLSSKPENTYKDSGWISYYSFCEYRAPEYYETYEEAKEATRKLGIKSNKEYIFQKRYKEDPKLPSQPTSFYKNKGWINWNDFIPSYYAVYNDAHIASINLSIKNREEYIGLKRYKEDPLLPSNPEKSYANSGWINWYVFLGNEIPKIYKTYLEAKMAANKIGICSMKEYKKRYKEDPSLPSSPSEVYKNRGWKSFYDFYNISERDYYHTYSEAQKAAQILGIKNRRQYQELKHYKKDSRLTRIPDILYESIGWINWHNFLGSKQIDIYPTYIEAKNAVQKLGIVNGTDYKGRSLYKQDPRLPSSPDKQYKNKGWINFYDFFGIDKPGIGR